MIESKIHEQYKDTAKEIYDSFLKEIKDNY